MGVVDKIGKYINSSSYTWVPIAVFLTVLLIAAIVGWINGWKTSLYFFTWNAVGFAGTIFGTGEIIDLLNKIAYFKVFSTAVKEWTEIIVVFLLMLVINFFAFCFYWFFRGKFKIKMKANKKYGASNLGTRWMGLGIAISSSLPTAIMFSQSTAVMSKQNSYTKFLDTLTKGISFGKFNGPNESRTLLSNLSAMIDFFKTFSGNVKAGDIDPKTMGPALQEIIDSGNFAGKVHTIYDSVKAAGLIDKNIDLATVKEEDIKKNVPALGIILTNPQQVNLIASLTELFGKDKDGDKKAIALINKIRTPIA